LEIVIAPAVEEDAGELLTVQRAAFLAEGELNNSFRLPPLTETLDEVFAAWKAGLMGLSCPPRARR
jgi:hypothetical protein